MEQKNETAIVKQQSQLAVLTTIALPPSSEKGLQLHFQAKKIRDFDGSDLRNLHLSILAICKFIGVTEAPEDAVVKLLIEHLQEHHRDFSIEEVKRAFSLATAGKLNFEFNHWNRITPQLLSLTLNKYKEQRNKDLVLFTKEQEKLKSLEYNDNQKPSEKEMLEMNVKYSIDLFEGYKAYANNSSEYVFLPTNDYGNVAYRFLDRIGCIKLTSEEKLELYKQATNIVIERAKLSRKTLNELKKIREEANRKASYEVARESMQIALINFFNELIKNKTELTVLINKALQEIKTT